LNNNQVLSLFPYQQEGVKQLVSRKRLLLADEMGLGKTVQCIEAINRIAKKDSIILVICPKSVLGVWQSELETWLQPTLKSTYTIHVASTKAPPLLPPGSITLINYDICHKLKSIVQQRPYDVLICDEAHYLKSRDSQRSKAILGELSNEEDSKKKSRAGGDGIVSEFLWLLTGTPVLNRPVELFPLVHAIAPLEFPSFQDYANQYCEPKSKMIYTKGRPITIQDYSGSSNLKELAQRLDPIMVRRYKMDVLSQLPPKLRSCTCLTSDLDISKQERELFALTTGLDLNEFGSNADSLMSYVGSSVDLLAKVSKVRPEIALLKLKPAIELLEEYISQEKVVVFAHHRAVIDELMKHFGDSVAVGIKGGMARERRDEAVRRFQEDSTVRLFVGSLKAASVGLTLTAASHVVFLELDWSPGVMIQAEDRCHRVGQANSVRIQYFVFKDTIDEWLSRSLMFKQNTINKILPEKMSSGEEGETGYVFTFGKHGTFCNS
jgi:SNF2 family DNA or RNA helicase